MSQSRLHDLQCPHCGHRQETMVWDSINVSLDPELKRKLFTAEINVFACESCGQKAFIKAPLLYHDMTLQFCVQYYPPESLGDRDFLSQFTAEGLFDLAGLPPAFANLDSYITRPHIVFDMNEMVRYVSFRELVAEANRQ